MGWSLPGISYPIECVYTQTLGVRPDVAILTCNPQVGSLPRLATLTMTWGADTVTLPNCQLDLARVTLAPEGFSIRIPAIDRRWKWSQVASISGHYNVVRAGAYVAAFKKNLRQLATILLTAMGEASADVSALPTNIYPEVRWDWVDPDQALEELLEMFGFSVSLGFGAEVVKVVQLGTGTTLPTTNVFVPSTTFDPKVRPRWVKTCFGPSVGQYRFRAKPVALETDDTWVDPAVVSYKPADGWEKEDPEILPTVVTTGTDDTYNRASGSVYRAYRIEKFADDTLNVPSGGSIGGSALGSISEILPIQNRGLTVEYARSEGSYKPIRVWAKHDRKVRIKGNPEAVRDQVDVNYEITRYDFVFDGETGILIFDEPLFFVNDSGYQFAEVYVEAAVSRVDGTTNALKAYSKDVSFDTSGTGYVNVKNPELREEIVVTYGTNHAFVSSVNNQTALDTTATANASQLTASMTDAAGQDVIYSIPKLSIRCDGAIRQVQHVMTNGEGAHAVNRTRASRHIEFDRHIHTRPQRIAIAKNVTDKINDRWREALAKRRERTDD